MVLVSSVLQEQTSGNLFFAKIPGKAFTNTSFKILGVPLQGVSRISLIDAGFSFLITPLFW